jgi:hypothetical protein
MYFKKQRQLEGFEPVTDPVDIANEIDKQILYVEYMKQRDPASQTSIYLPHIDVMKKFEKSTNDMLSGLTEQIKTHSIKKEDEINRLSGLVLDMDRYADKDLTNKYESREVVGLKSHNNGLTLGLTKLDSTGTKYAVNVNNQCLSVPADNQYDVIPCNKDDPNQKFSIDYVYNTGQYKNKLAHGYPKLDNMGVVKYPFVFLKAGTNKNCVKNHHGLLSVEPCREYVGQRWGPIVHRTGPAQ